MHNGNGNGNGTGGKPLDLVYITSPSFSGSTLLTFLLAAHPKVATIGELKATSMGNIDLYDCSCGQRIRSCPFWQRVGEELAARRIEFDLADFGTHFRARQEPLTDRVLRPRLRGALLEATRDAALAVLPGPRRTFNRILDKNRALIEVIMKLRNGQVFLDGSKDPVRLKFLLSDPHYRVKVIYLIRDGRGATNSYMKHYSCDMYRAVKEWRWTHEACDRLVEKLPAGNVYTLRYEDLCRTPDDHLAALFNFMGLRPEESARDFRAMEHHLLGNSMRLGNSSEIKLDEKWKVALRPEDLVLFNRVAGDLNRKYGYE